MANGSQERLTPREEEVLELVKQFKSNAEIAEELVIEERTVETHVHKVLEKLGYRDRRDLWADLLG